MLLKLRAEGLTFYNRVDFVCFHAIAGNSHETEISGARRVEYCLVVAYGIGLYRENAIAVRVIDRSAYDATSLVHAHRQQKNLSYLRNGCCIYYLRPSAAAHL